MNNGALITMVLTQIVVASLTIYFYRRVLKTPMKDEPDSYSENDEIPRD